MRLSHILNEALLYRGDSQKIDAYDINVTDAAALLGPGIYLTNDPAVAGDYTAARGHERVFPSGFHDSFKSSRELIHGYVTQIAWKMFGDRKFAKDWIVPHGEPTTDKAQRKLELDTKNAWEERRQDLIKDAIEQVRKELPTLRVQKLTTGELVLVRRDRPASIATFDIPESYLAKTLHADRPMPDAVLAVMKKLWLAVFPNDNGDLRDHNERNVNFDTYVDNYRRYGTRYVWRDDDEGRIGGKGENPSLDDLMNGTHGGYHAFKVGTFDERTKAMALIKALMDLGYVGLEYDGGTRVAGHTRGGGGRRHRAFVFWDTAALAKFRVADSALPATKRMTVRSLPTVSP
jgi:hypothetical protein